MIRLARRATALAVTSILAALVLLGCGDDDTATGAATPRSEPRVIVVGVAQSLTGAGDNYGPHAIAGIELAVARINAEAPRTGIRFEMRVIDDRSSVESARAAFADLLAAKVDAIIGPTLSNASPEAHRTAQQAGVPVLGATTTGAGITDTGDYVFRIALPEAVVVPAALARVSRDASLQRAVLVLDSNDAFSRSSAAAMRTGIAAIGGTIIGEIDLARTEVESELGRLQGQPVDAFLVTTLVDAAVAVLTAIRSAGYEQTIIGGNSFNTLDIATLAGGAVEGAYVGAAWNPGVNAPASKAFVHAFTAKYGEAPDLFAAQGYASAWVLYDAVRRAKNPTGAALRDALASTRDLETPLGSLSMSEKREASHTPVTQRYRDGELVVVP